MVLAEVEGACHAEFGIELLGGVGVDGEGAGSCGGVEGDEVWLAATDDDEGGGDGKGVEGLGGDGGAEGAEVFLAVLWKDVSIILGEERELRKAVEVEGRTYSAEEVADEDYEDSPVFL